MYKYLKEKGFHTTSVVTYFNSQIIQGKCISKWIFWNVFLQLVWHSLSVFSSLLGNYLIILIAFSFIPRDSSFPIRCPRLWDYRLILSLYLDGWIFIVHNLNGLSRIFFLRIFFLRQGRCFGAIFSPFFPFYFLTSVGTYPAVYL